MESEYQPLSLKDYTKSPQFFNPLAASKVELGMYNQSRLIVSPKKTQTSIKKTSIKHGEDLELHARSIQPNRKDKHDISTRMTAPLAS